MTQTDCLHGSSIGPIDMSKHINKGLQWTIYNATL